MKDERMKGGGQDPSRSSPAPRPLPVHPASLSLNRGVALCAARSRRGKRPEILSAQLPGLFKGGGAGEGEMHRGAARRDATRRRRPSGMLGGTKGDRQTNGPTDKGGRKGHARGDAQARVAFLPLLPRVDSAR